MDMAEIKSRTRKPDTAKAADLSSFVFGKIPPQAKDLEEAVLGAVLIEKDALTAVVDILKTDTFYVEAHKKIYEAILNLFSKSQPVDILTVAEELKSSGDLESVGGQAFIAGLTERVASAANVEHHARIISQKYIQRELINISTTIVNEAYEDTTDVFELLDKAEQNLFSIADQNLRRSSETMTDLVAKAIKNLEELRENGSESIGVPSGFQQLDAITSGWQNSDLVILAARPGMGKTSFALSLIRNAAVDFDRSVALFSLEMSSLQLVNRLISIETELPMEKLKKGNLAMHEWQQLSVMVEKLVDAKIHIDDTPAINIFELRAKCRRLKSQHEVGLFVIDYLQLMSGTNADGKGSNREQEISQISRSLKSIAKELNTPVIALSQLSREVEKRGGSKKPQLSDLRESGAIEQDADMVIFLYRPEYYDMNEDADGNSLKGIAEVIIAKHRNGALATVPVRFIDKFAKFQDLDQSDYARLEGGSDDSYTTFPSRMDDMQDEESPF
jgi:replicative DNA helicase